MMRGKFILIYGSASRSCPLDKLDAAIDLVRCFVTEVLRRGGGVVVLARIHRRDEVTAAEWAVRVKGRRWSGRDFG